MSQASSNQNGNLARPESAENNHIENVAIGHVRRGAISHENSLLEPPILDAETTNEFVSPWPINTHENAGRPDVTNKCPHHVVYPCFCRKDTDAAGFPCQDCRFPICEFTRYLLSASVEEIQLELDREIARDRNAEQFEEEIRSALDDALQREEDHHRWLETVFRRHQQG